MAIKKQTKEISSLYYFALPLIAQIIPALYLVYTSQSSSLLFLATSTLATVLGILIFSKLNSRIERDILNKLSLFTTAILSVILIIVWGFVIVNINVHGASVATVALFNGYSSRIITFLSQSTFTWVWLLATLIPLIRLLILNQESKPFTKEGKRIRSLLVASELTYISTPFVVYFGTQLILSLSCRWYIRDFCGFWLIIPCILALSFLTIATGTILLITAVMLRKKYSNKS